MHITPEGGGAGISTPPGATTAPTLAMTALTYAAMVEETLPWIIQDLLPAGGSLLIHGQAKQGKSIAAMQMAYAIACGDDEWLGFKVTGHGPVLYVQLDTGRQIWKERTIDMNALGYEAKDLWYVDKVSAPTPFNVLNPLHALMLRQEVERIQPVVVFIDVLRKVSALGENDSDEMIAVLNALEAAVKPAALVIITHTKKNGSGKFATPARDLLMGGARGSGALVGNVDAILMILKKKLWFHSRVIDANFLKVKFQKCGKRSVMWVLDLDQFHAALAAVLREGDLVSVSDKARALADRTGKKFEACRTAIRHALEDRGPIGAHEGDDEELDDDAKL